MTCIPGGDYSTRAVGDALTKTHRPLIETAFRCRLASIPNNGTSWFAVRGPGGWCRAIIYYGDITAEQYHRGVWWANQLGIAFVVVVRDQGRLWRWMYEGEDWMEV